jgi:hypothetical protein
MWEEVVVAWYGVWPGICLERLSRVTKSLFNIVGALADIPTEQLRNMCEKHHRLR